MTEHAREIRPPRWRKPMNRVFVLLQRLGLSDGPTASRALGYAQVLEVLAGRCTERQARDETVRATRRFARRQLAWFRKDPRIRWLPHDASDRTEQALAQVGLDV